MSEPQRIETRKIQPITGHATKRASPWRLGGLGPIELARRVWQTMDVTRDDTFGRSAELAFYFLLAVFPLLVCFLTVLGLMVGNHPIVGEYVLTAITRVMPGVAGTLVQDTLQQTALHSAGWLMAVGVLGALWSGSAGVAALITTLNVAYGIKDTRPMWRQRALAIVLTIVLGVLFAAAIMISLLGGWLVHAMGGAIGLGVAFRRVWRVGEYAIALLFVVVAYAALYRWAPDRKERRWTWLTPGALIGVSIWIAAAAGLRIYLHFFDNYSKSYGSVGAVIVLMLWFYVTGFSMLTGAEINAVIEDAAAQHGHPEAQRKGQQEK